MDLPVRRRYEKLTSAGRLCGDLRYAWHDLRPAYHWLRGVQARHVPDASGRSLLWAFATWSQIRAEWDPDRRPDGYLLTLRLPLSRVLLSDGFTPGPGQAAAAARLFEWLRKLGTLPLSRH